LTIEGAGQFHSAWIVGAAASRPRAEDFPAVALQDLLGHAWLHSGSDPRAADDTRRHERSLWCHSCAPGPADRRPPPSARMGATHMPRAVFLALALGWGGVLAAVLAVVAAIRWMG